MYILLFDTVFKQEIPFKKRYSTALWNLRLVQSFQLSFILIILLYYRYIHFLFSDTPMKAKTVTNRVKVLLERIISCLYEILAEYRHISTVWAVSSLCGTFVLKFLGGSRIF